uniref:HTH_Tnp_Tc3_2 domain-containing protein n=1 Tax=Caenorhabditis japonica TaxID=281687 RepID=A0A8R1DGT3_CAEJA
MNSKLLDEQSPRTKTPGGLLYGLQVSNDTVKRRLRHAGLFEGRLVKKPMIPEKNRSARLNPYHYVSKQNGYPEVRIC